MYSLREKIAEDFSNNNFNQTKSQPRMGWGKWTGNYSNQTQASEPHDGWGKRTRNYTNNSEDSLGKYYNPARLKQPGDIEYNTDSDTDNWTNLDNNQLMEIQRNIEEEDNQLREAQRELEKVPSEPQMGWGKWTGQVKQQNNNPYTDWYEDTSNWSSDDIKSYNDQMIQAKNERDQMQNYENMINYDPTLKDLSLDEMNNYTDYLRKSNFEPKVQYPTWIDRNNFSSQDYQPVEPIF